MAIAKSVQTRSSAIKPSCKVRCRTVCYAAPIKMQDTNANSMVNLPQNNHVQIIETEASIRCGLRPSTFYDLVVELSQIVLHQDNKVLFLWPFKHVRRYGYTSNSFSIEAGSKCTTGEGLFIFRSHKSIQLYNQIIANVAKIKQLKTRQLLRRSSNASVDRVSQDERIRDQSVNRETNRLTLELGMCSLGEPLESNHQSSSLVKVPVPHYVRNNCEYAQIVKRSSHQAS